MEAVEYTESLSESVDQVIALLDEREFLQKESSSEDKARTTVLLERNFNALYEKLSELHPADIAHILETLPLERRLEVWELVKAGFEGDVLVEVSDAVRHTLIADMDSDELLAVTEQLDTDELADIAQDLPKDVLQDLLDSLDVAERERLQSTLSYPDNTVGALMDFDLVMIREDVTLEVTLRYLRRLGTLPQHTDKMFVIDREGIFHGVLPLRRIVVEDPDKLVSEVMVLSTVIFHPEDIASEAAQAFERYDLITAPVVDEQNKLIARITVSEVMDFIRTEETGDQLAMAGLRKEEDFFADVGAAIKNRWTWLAINLVTAFIASRVIGVFEGSIQKIVALAALMPIVAGVGGNSGNQTITMIVRGIALGQITTHHMKNLLIKELGVALFNGVAWGSVLAVATFFLYGSLGLSFVMMLAMVLNLMLGATMGVIIPMLLNKLGRDPAVGTSVLITAMTDSGGFFIFLGLATLFLLR